MSSQCEVQLTWDLGAQLLSSVTGDYVCILQTRSDLAWKNEQNNRTLQESKPEQLASWRKVLPFSHLYAFYQLLFFLMHSRSTSQTSQPTT